jgi:CRISPR system Cascade subunit CasB
MTVLPDVAPETDRVAPQSDGSIISRIALELTREGFPRGDLAAVRRLDPDHPSAPAFWRLLMRTVPEDRRRSPDAERRWALILHGMALMAPHHHDPAIPVGRALFVAGYSEQRLGRLLDARGLQFCALLPRLCRQLAQKPQALDWRELGQLVRSIDHAEEKAENIRVRIARSYYGAEAATGKADNPA